MPHPVSSGPNGSPDAAPWLLLGASGMLGKALLEVLQGLPVVGWSSRDLDITREDQVLNRIRALHPRVIIHAAAWTQVDACEKDPERAYRVNARGTRHVAQAARATGARLVYISTDYVFDGKGNHPYPEDAPPNPLNVYGRSKWEGEQAVLESTPDGLIVRTSWLFGPGGANFVDTILQLAQIQSHLRVVADQRGAPTYTRDLAEALRRLLETPARGIVHVTNGGDCTWWEFARAILQEAGIQGVAVAPISTLEAGRPAPRPAYSVLDTGRYTCLTGHQLRPWQEALRAYLRERLQRP